ncbi:polyhydroxyalkanoate synthase [Rubricella aquisinus]|uniref:Polyhydroxyalkanoate synthase n=1 Tax=Rubricella aquisinus TaxID=2028108 RepID=A0A840X0T1_9RHOB|nr:class I poly(R)-hydroxyalkanoic acid synthase [Rubricella aquisinus]MBB5516334.1 polyhydroxyalkanoate synthase [Rubricella aquisinus]
MADQKITLPEDIAKDVPEWMQSSAEFAANMAKVSETSQEIWTRFLSAQGDSTGPMHSDPLNTMPAFTEFANTLAAHPNEVAEATLAYWTSMGELWRDTTLRWLGAEMPEEQGRPDKRFKHKEWSENLLFDYLKKSYLLTANHLQQNAHDLGEMDPRDRKKVEFYTRTFVEAMSPTNFFGLNPEVLESTMNEKGENLVRGLNMMLQDLDRGKGQLLIRQTDMEQFKVGQNMAMTEGQVVFENELMQLIQYAPLTEKVYAKPLLMIPPWINKYYVLDLNEKKSMMKWLVEQGYTVFIISWVNPDERSAGETWESYREKGVSTAIDKVLEETGQKQTHIASYCIGGTMAGTFLAHAGKTKDKRVASATFFTAQLDFEDAGELQVFVDEQTIEAVEGQMEKGYLPAQSMASAFNMLRSSDLIWGYVINNYMLGKEPFPFDLLYWNSDSTSMPARVHRFYLEQFYQDNNFACGDLKIGGLNVKLSDINVPVYHVAAKEDHIAPAASVYRGARMMTGADVHFVLAGSGHIAGVVNPPALGKYQYWVNDDYSSEDITGWLEQAEERPGSWWVDWDAWLSKQSGRKVNARTPGKVLGTIEPAPGSYVKVRFDEKD